MENTGRILTLLALLAFLSAAPVCGQTTQQPAGVADSQAAFADPIRQLNLTPEQREQIRSIRENNKAERVTINNELREANRLLDEALNSETPDEALVEQRLHNLNKAQAAAMRMRILTEIRIRQVLTSEQRSVLRSLQQQVREARRERLLAAPERQQRREERRALRNQRNGLAPLLPRRENPRRPRL